MVARLLDAVKKFGARFLAEPNAANTATEKSGSVARQRLQLLIAHQRTGSQLPGVNFQQLQSDLVECIQVRVIAQTPCAAAIVSSPPCPAPFRNAPAPSVPPSFRHPQRHLQLPNESGIKMNGADAKCTCVCMSSHQ
jgi:hypothetical protein